MGAAKQRAAQLEAWLDTLSSDERVVFSVAMAAYEGIIRALGATGFCYRMSFFLATFLDQEHKIRVDPVVGYINDGESEVMASHAWIECAGKKVDLALTTTEYPEAQLTGPLLILDRQLTKGRATYAYHRERSPSAVKQVKELMKDPRFGEVLHHKESEHERMTATAKDAMLMRAYLDAAPDGLGYEQLARRIDPL